MILCSLVLLSSRHFLSISMVSIRVMRWPALMEAHLFNRFDLFDEPHFWIELRGPVCRTLFGYN